MHIWTLKGGVITEELSASSPQPEDASVPVEILALSPDGLTSIVCDINRNPRHYLWSTTTCQPLPLTSTGDEDILGYLMAFSPNGRFFAASSSNDGITTLRVWNTRTGELVAGSSRLDSKLRCLAFSPDDHHIAFSYLLSHTDTTSIWILDVHTGHLASGPWKGHTSHVTTLAFSSDGEKLASGSWDGQIRIWNAADLLGHRQASVEGFRNEKCMENGWVVGENEELLFWLPKDHREGLFWPGNIAVIGGSGIPTHVDLTTFRYGENWAECIGGGE
jgi:WD40 repeat protein